MKLIKAIIKPERFEKVKKSLEDNGIFGMTVTEVKGRGDQKGITLQYRGGSMIVDLIPKVEVDIVVMDSDSDKVVGLICDAAQTGKIGDGRIFVLPVERSIKVRTGEEVNQD